jgi:ribose transport system substrate-binding protein
MKRCAAIFIILSIILTFTACVADQQELSAADAAADTEDAAEASENSALVQDVDLVSDPLNYQFAIVYGGVHPYFEPYEPGAKAAAKDLGIPEPYITSPQAWDQTEQNKVLDGVIARGATGIAMFPSDAVAGNEQITKMVNLGIPVVTLGGSPAEPSDAEFCFATDVGASVALGTQALIDKLKENGLTGGNIVHLCSSLGDTNTQKRQAAIKEVLARPENAGFVLFQELADTDATEPAEKAISAMFASYIDQVDGIICTGYVNAQVLAKTMMEKNEQRVVAIGIDDSKDVLDAIEAGIMYGTMTQNPWGMGYVGIYALKLLKDGYTYKEDKPFFIDSGYFLLTNEGLPTYQETLEANTKEFVTTMKDEYFNPPEGS